MLISVIIPCYNEENYILEILKKVNKQKLKFNLEIIVCDDFSTDKTNKILKENTNLYNRLIVNDKNSGKGSSIINSLKICTGELILIQDADQEYNPEDYEGLLKPFIHENADVVYGSRFTGSFLRRVIYYKNQIANKFLTFLVNILTDKNFTDIECGYKVFKKSILEKCNLKEKTFTFETEVTMKISKTKSKIYEVGVSYSGRTIEEGKKIKLKDGILAIYTIFKYRFFD